MLGQSSNYKKKYSESDKSSPMGLIQTSEI